MIVIKFRKIIDTTLIDACAKRVICPFGRSSCIRKKKAPIGDAHMDRISRENNIIQIDLPGGSTKISMFIWAMFEVFRFGPARPALIR